ncbi:ParA family protein [Novipirellula artificiosorum]|uniref:MinD/ParA/CobQ/CobA-like protein n=1 Tax=Novipirellula artificiosorum TaxID=2528016 RepID=A0A5C6DJ00_9BACT|nr:ParA family protein [Novipirellula artificiosorum]TWU34896.1 MinD/ParA/CobQ/CobA-like protein [Novipirellula artificiosorum]
MERFTICLINQKGGCGKSSTCFHLAGSLAVTGLSVLLVDADPQGSLSQGFFGSEVVEQLPLCQTLAALFDEGEFFSDPNALIRNTGFDNISILPTNHHLGAFNVPCPEKGGMLQYAIRDFLDQLDRFDVVLIDCPPNLYQCSWNTMIASDYVIIPVPPEDFGTQGLRAVHQCIDHARQLNPKLRRLGHLVTRHDKRLLVHRSYEQRLREIYDRLVFDTIIPEASAFKVSIACRQPAEFFDKRSYAAESMRALTNEVLDYIRNKSQRHVA